MKAKGKSGSVELYDDKIKIVRDGILANLLHLGKGDKEIPIDNISSIEFKEPKLQDGYIQFGQSGYSESKGGTMDALKDENSVTFSSTTSIEEFKELKDRINEKRKNQKDNNSNSQNKEPSAVERLKQRYAEGEIDKEEYEEKLEDLQK